MSVNKGGAFERSICKDLSLWWTDGARDDIFWRTSGSGARATTRSKTGQNTFGQYGDVQATDPIGQPLIDWFTIEIKRGYNSCTFVDTMQAERERKTDPLLSFLSQTVQSATAAGTPYWLLIHKRDRKATTLTTTARASRALGIHKITPRLSFHRATKSERLIQVRWNSFLAETAAKDFLKNIR